MKTNFNTTVEGREPRAEGQKQVEGRASKAESKSPVCESVRLSTLDSRLSTVQSGVALIITLILLSVVTFMALTFLALSRRERRAVATVTDTAGARLAADAALANAEAQIIANALSTTNPYSFGLLVSTNYINPYGFVAGNPANPTNVNYYYHVGGPVSAGDMPQLLANLYYSPRAPVWMSNTVSRAMENRFYLDLNRNGRDDPNGYVTNYDNAGNILYDASGNDLIWEVGDPEWIGILERPDAPYGPNNKFVARYAFIAVPIGNALDLNAIHNQSHMPVAPPALPANWTVNPPANNINNPDSFTRNEGVGSWEINLAAFLADLNTNQWDPPTAWNHLNEPYQYPWFAPGKSVAIDDARALLAYRYNNDFNSSLKSIRTLFSPAGMAAFTSDGIDGYSYGQPLMTGFQLPGEMDNALKTIPWAGGDNTNLHRFFNHQELFDPAKTEIGATPPGFVERLLAAGQTNSTYDRYTFYRLLSQLGTDSEPESGKMNLNYDNLVQTNANGVVSETNFYSWTAINFFTNAADRLLRAYTTEWRNSNPTNFAMTFYAVPPDTFTNVNFNADQWTNYPAFGITNIPVLVSNRFVYSSAVNRLLQLAANMYDATTNRYYPPDYGMALPTLFQPVFGKVFDGLNTNVYITNFVEYTGSGMSLTNTVPLDLGNPVDLGNLLPYNLVYGVPIIVGAKKGLPNFNQFAMQSAFLIQRKLLFTRTSANASPDTFSVYEQFGCSVSNQFAVECWNSYTNNYPRSTTIWVSGKNQIMLTNDETQQPCPPLDTINSFATVLGNWTGNGYWVTNYAANLLPTASNAVAGPTEVYQFSTRTFITNQSAPFETNLASYGLPPYPQPYWWLIMTNDLQVVLIDTSSGRAIDYVQLRGPTGVRDLTAEINNQIHVGIYWNTNIIQSSVPAGLPSGVWSQINDALNYNQGANDADMAGLQNFYFHHVNPDLNYPHTVYGSTNLQVQIWFSSPPLTVQHITWQANDPLVHYLASDLTDTANNTNAQNSIAPSVLDKNYERYQPWGVPDPSNQKQMAKITGVDPNTCNLAFKDPLVRRSDDWDFPTNKFPTVGWLGRVHRGTPWQTVFLKATNVLAENSTLFTGTNTWANWTGDLNVTDATNMAPVQDRLLFDLFTTAFNDNATRGTLSVNVEARQTNNPAIGPAVFNPAAGLAAWSALFSGVEVLSNNAVDNNIQPLRNPQHNGSLVNYTNFPINPAGLVGANSALGRIVQGINQRRLTFINNDGLVGTFEHAGDILSVPQLTEQSPFLNPSSGVQLTNGISDEMYEWLPQQTMSLLRCSSSPRYVIYCYGQTLKPAPDSIVTSGTYFGMITNYQVVSEIATRAVVRFGSTLTNVVTSINILGVPYWYSMPVVTNNNAVIESFNILPPD